MVQGSKMEFSQKDFIVPFFVLLGLLCAAASVLFGFLAFADIILATVLLLGMLPFVRGMLLSMWKGHFGIDLIAVTGMLASLLIHEYLAGAVILLMLSGGSALESFARRRARKELTQLLSRAPTKAHLKKQQDILDVPVTVVQVSDLVVVKPGETVPVDGVVVKGRSMVDEAALTGESMPVEKDIHHKVMSGSINLEGVLEVRATKISSESKYSQIVRLVREAEEKKAPFVRMADRYSVFFTVLTFSLSFLAWFISGDPVRALAVLVVATPCPLILATPIAFTSGMSRAAKRGIIIKSGEAIEKLAEAKSFIFDKTGTITVGVPKVTKVTSLSQLKETEIQRISASLDQLSAHVLADALVSHTKELGINLDYPDEFEEKLGYGVKGKFKGQQYFFGKLSYLKENKVQVPEKIETQRSEVKSQGIIPVYLAREKKLLGTVFFADQLRSDAVAEFASLKTMVDKLALLTGDQEQVARQIGARVGIEDIRSERLPEQKLEDVREIRRDYAPVVMVGDGINDAPALAAADVGIVIGNGGTTAAREAGDIIITVDSFDRVSEAFRLSRHVLLVAKQGILIGIGLSLGLMVLAAFGLIVPVVGAIIQELIDVLVIMNALRVYRTESNVALPKHVNHQ